MLQLVLELGQLAEDLFALGLLLLILVAVVGQRTDRAVDIVDGLGLCLYGGIRAREEGSSTAGRPVSAILFSYVCP